MVFNLCILIVKKILLKFLIVSMKALTNPADLSGSRIRISNSGGTSKGIGTSI